MIVYQNPETKSNTYISPILQAHYHKLILSLNTWSWPFLLNISSMDLILIEIGQHVVHHLRHAKVSLPP